MTEQELAQIKELERRLEQSLIENEELTSTSKRYRLTIDQLREEFDNRKAQHGVNIANLEKRLEEKEKQVGIIRETDNDHIEKLNREIRFLNGSSMMKEKELTSLLEKANKQVVDVETAYKKLLTEQSKLIDEQEALEKQMLHQLTLVKRLRRRYKIFQWLFWPRDPQ